MNTYAYASDNPIIFIDSDGLIITTVAEKLFNTFQGGDPLFRGSINERLQQTGVAFNNFNLCMKKCSNISCNNLGPFGAGSALEVIECKDKCKKDLDDDLRTTDKLFPFKKAFGFF